MDRVILHVDMDAFYAAVEQRDRPGLRGRPVIVGGSSDRGVVSTASYEARRFGVHSAMPRFQAEQKCPHAVFLPVRMERYREASRQVMEVLDAFSPLVEQVSIDEAYLDLTGTERHAGSAEVAARKLKRRILQATALTCSVGIAPNRFLAKIASDMEKPDGLTLIRAEDVALMIRRLPVCRVPGIGPKAAVRLESLGVRFLADIRHIPRDVLQAQFGRRSRRMMDLANGMDETPVASPGQAKSISSEETLPRNTGERQALEKELLIQAERVGERVRSKGLQGWTVTLKLRRSDYTWITRSTTLKAPTSSTRTLYEHGTRLLKRALNRSGRYRLIGIGLSGLVPKRAAPEQMPLFNAGTMEERGSWEAAEEAMDTIRKRFGQQAITRGSLVAKKDP